MSTVGEQPARRPFGPRRVCAVLAAAVLLGATGACARGPRWRPANELARGAAAVVPWASLSVSAQESRPRVWTRFVRNPLGVRVELPVPRVVGCGRCIEVAWVRHRGPGVVTAAGGAVLEPGDSARLELRYTGAPAGGLGRYALDFEVADGSGPALRVPLTVHYVAAVPHDPMALSLRAVAGGRHAASTDWGFQPASRPAEIGAWSGEAALDALLWRPETEGSRGRLLLVSRTPWQTYQAGLLELRYVDDDGSWRVPWRCIGAAPFEVRLLPHGSGRGGTLVVDSRVDHAAAVSLAPLDGRRAPRRLWLRPRELAHLSLSAERSTHRNESGVALVARMDDYAFETRVDLP